MASSPSTATSRLRPVWLSESAGITYEPLAQHLATEICIVGGGISALTTAWLLLQSGKQVTILMPTDLRSGVASQSSAHLSTALPMRYHQLEYLHGATGARMIAASHLAGIELMEQISRSMRLDCGFTRLDGYVMVPPGESLDELEREYAATQRAGLHAVHWVNEVPLRGFHSGRALQFPGQAQFHPLRYLTQLAARITSAGGRIFGHTQVSAVSLGASPRMRTTHGHEVECKAVVWAADTPLHAVLNAAPGVGHSRYDHLVIAARIPAQGFAPMLIWDTATPGHHARVAHLGGDGVNTPADVLIVNCREPLREDALTHEQRFRLLELWALERFPMIERIEYRWHWRADCASDGLADIGRCGSASEQLFVGGDDPGNSLTHGFISALINSSLILERSQPWAALYEPSRRTLRVGTPEQPPAILPAYADYAPGHDHLLPRGSGVVLRRGLGEVALAIDADGRRLERSAKCPHLGGVVAWNAERSRWECPYHGSCFDASGHVLCGPAQRDLDANLHSRPAPNPLTSNTKREGPAKSQPQPQPTRQS